MTSSLNKSPILISLFIFPSNQHQVNDLFIVDILVFFKILSLKTTA